MNEPSPLGIICGGGGFPFAVADAVRAQGRDVFLIGLAGSAQSQVSAYPHKWVRLGQFGHFVRALKQAGCQDIVFVGGVTRPSSWRDLVPDLGMVRRLPRIVSMFRGGDNHVLVNVVRLAEEAGFRVVGVHDVVPQIVLGLGVQGQRAPQKHDLEDARIGFDILKALSPHDVGQGVVVVDRRVVALEAAEGTDAMLARVAELRRTGRVRLGEGRGVFVKAPKIGQDLRVDMPALGPDTVSLVHQAGLAGIAAVAGHVLMLDAEQMMCDADAKGVFISGFPF
jgi:DUF1009 family protein